MRKIESWGTDDEMFESCEWMIWKGRDYECDYDYSVGQDLADFLVRNVGKTIEYCDTPDGVFFRIAKD